MEPVEHVLRRVPTQARSREKVERALSAAESLLEREGADSITLPRVAQEAGVSVGALYQYLPDREAIVEALSATYYGRLEDLMDRLVADLSATRPEDPVGAVIEAMADLYRDASGTRALRSMLMGASQTAQARAHKQRMVAKTHTLLAAYGIVDADAPDTVARAIFFASDGIMHEAFTEGDRAGLVAELETMLRAYLTDGT